MKSDVKYLLLATICLLFLLPSCTKKEYEPNLKGSLVGYVVLFDEFSKPLADYSKVMALAIRKDEVFKTFTDMNGRFEFKDLPAGTYELHLEKQGYGTMKQFGIQHFGGEPTILRWYDSPFVLFQKSTAEILSINIGDGVSQIKFLNSPPQHVILSVFTSLESDFDINHSNRTTTLLNKSDVSNELWSGGFDFYDNYKSGDTIYLRACVSPDYGLTSGISHYFDYYENYEVYPGLSKESAQYSYVIP